MSDDGRQGLGDDAVDAAIAKLNSCDIDLLLGRCSGWGSWMWSSGSHMCALGLGTKRLGSIDFDTPLAAAVIAKLKAASPTPSPHHPPEGE